MSKDLPLLVLGGTTLTGGEPADRISQQILAFEALGEGTGARREGYHSIVSRC